MSLVQLFVPTEVAHDAVAELGELGNVQFKDVSKYCGCYFRPIQLTSVFQLNPDVTPFQRSFVGEIRRVDEMARRVRFFSTQIEKEKDVIPIRPLYDSAPLITVGPRAAQTIDDLDVTLAEHEARLQQMNDSYKTLSERTKELIEARHVLRETAVFFEKVIAPTHLFIIPFDVLHRLKINTPTSERLLMTAQHLCCSMMIARISSLRPVSNSISSLWQVLLTVRAYLPSSGFFGVFSVATST